MLLVDVRAAVQELLKPMFRPRRIAGPVKSAVWFVQPAFQHGEYFFVPGDDLVPVTVFDAGAPQAVHMLFIIRTQAVDALPEYQRGVVAANTADAVGPEYLLHGLNDVSLQRSLGVAQKHVKPIHALGGQQPLGNDIVHIHPGFSAARCTCFDVPTVRCIIPVSALQRGQDRLTHLYPAFPGSGARDRRPWASARCRTRHGSASRSP